MAFVFPVPMPPRNSRCELSNSSESGTVHAAPEASRPRKRHRSFFSLEKSGGFGSSRLPSNTCTLFMGRSSSLLAQAIVVVVIFPLRFRFRCGRGFPARVFLSLFFNLLLFDLVFFCLALG